MNKDFVDQTANNYVDHVKKMSDKDLYAFFYGTYTVRSKALKTFLSDLKLTYTQYKALMAELDEIDPYVDALIPKPKKKIVKKKKSDDSDDDE